MVGLVTTTKADTTFIACSTTTISTILPKPTPTLNPTPTKPVKCYPTYGGKPITDLDQLIRHINPDVRGFCGGTNPGWLTFIGGNTQEPCGNNLVKSGYKLNDNAPIECKDFYKGNLPSLQLDLCAAPFEAIKKACPWNGGIVETVCGKAWLVTCLLGGGACLNGRCNSRLLRNSAYDSCLEIN